MRPRTLLAALLLCPFAVEPLPAQERPAPAAPAKDVAAELDALLAALDAALSEHRRAFEALYAGYDETTASEERRAEVERRHAELDARDPAPAYVARLADLAARAKGTETAARALLRVLELDRTPAQAPASPARSALAELLAEHLGSPQLRDVTRILQYASLDRATRRDAYAKLAAGSKLDEVVAGSLFSLALELTVDEARGGDHARARALLVDVGERFGAFASPFGRTYGELAAGFVFELDFLQLGMVAPDHEAVDQDGVRFRLSDYAGKVVVLDFWGLW
jgi:hypothetical protein